MNADLVGKLVNIASRCAGFIHRGTAGSSRPDCPSPRSTREFVGAGAGIAEAYESRDYAAAMREIMALADRANQYIDAQKPWVAGQGSGARR